MLTAIRNLLRRYWQELDRRFNFGYLRYQLFHENQQLEQFIQSRCNNQMAPTNPKSRSAEDTAVQPKFSVITPLYGVPLVYVKEFYQSLAQQSFDSWELCLCDDGDPTPGVLDFFTTLAQSHPRRIKLTRNPKNLGISAATRKALELAEGEFLVFVDSDDLLHQRAFELIAAKISEAPDYDLVYSNHDLMTEYNLRKTPILKPAWSPELLLHYNYINHLVIARRELYEKHQNDFFTSAINGVQDWDLVINLGHFARRVGHLPFQIYHWRERPGSVASGVSEKPWIIQAAFVLRQNFISKLSPNLQFNVQTAEYEVRPSVVEKFQLRKLVLKASDQKTQKESPLNNAAEKAEETIEKIELQFQESDPLTKTLEKIKNSLTNITNQEQSWVFFEIDEFPRIQGDLKKYLVYGLIEGVGCVWPFKKPGTRLGYTQIPQIKRTLIPISEGRLSFFAVTGNVLTGPLHGLCIRVSELLVRTEELLSDGKLSERDSSPHQLNFLGALIGLRGYSRSYRNLAVSQICCDIELTQLLLPATDSLEFDPYH